MRVVEKIEESICGIIENEVPSLAKGEQNNEL
jgi:hypothetical protein